MLTHTELRKEVTSWLQPEMLLWISTAGVTLVYYSEMNLQRQKVHSRIINETQLLYTKHIVAFSQLPTQTQLTATAYLKMDLYATLITFRWYEYDSFWTSICAYDIGTGFVSYLIAERDIPPNQSVAGELHLCRNHDVTPQNNYLCAVYMYGDFCCCARASLEMSS